MKKLHLLNFTNSPKMSKLICKVWFFSCFPYKISLIKQYSKPLYIVKVCKKELFPLSITSIQDDIQNLAEEK